MDSRQLADTRPVRTLALLVVWSIGSAVATAADWYVDDNASRGGDGSAGAPFRTIQKALNHAHDGDRVLIAAGRYDEPGIVTTNVTILGDPAGGTILERMSGIVVQVTGFVWIENLQFEQSGLSNDAWGTLVAVRCRVSGTSHAGIGSAYGGGVVNHGVLVMCESTVEDCGVVANALFGLGDAYAAGGGIYSQGVLKLFSCTVARNEASAATSGTGNTTAEGGGIYAFGALRLTNCTITGNRVVAHLATGGGAYCYGDGTLESVTVSSNIAETDGGYAWAGGFEFLEYPTDGEDTCEARHSIFGDNQVLPAGSSTAPDFHYELTSLGWNLIEDPTGCVVLGDPTGNLLGVDPMLLALADNGGSVATQALASGSPCLDAGSADALLAPAYDARNRPRAAWDPATGPADMGAFEEGPAASFLLTVTPDLPLPAGANFALVNGGGVGGAPVVLVLVDIGGTPTFVPLLAVAFDRAGVLYLPATAPSGLSGLMLSLESLSLDADGRLIQSNVETIAFQ